LGGDLVIATAYDAARLVYMMLHVGDALTDADLGTMIRGIERCAADVHARPGSTATNIVIVETDNAPNAAQRRRIADAAARIVRTREAFITSSAVVRGVLTAIHWLSPSDDRRVRRNFATYHEARTWLVAESRLPVEIFDALHRDVRAQADRAHAR
jgi:hypothetical protein